MSVEIDHLGIAVTSIEKSLPLFRDLLQMPVSAFEDVKTEQVRVAMIAAGAGSSAPRIELLESTAEHSSVAKFVQSRGPGLHHVALRVNNVAEMAATLTATGYQVLSEPRRGAGGHLYVFVHPRSTGGVLLELVEYTQSNEGVVQS